MSNNAALAIGAHPDDIEFFMGGTLLLLKQRGFEIHYLNVASGNCGSVRYSSSTTRRIRQAEARKAARTLGAHYHPSLTDDLQILYNVELLRGVAAVVRAAKPSIVLTHSPQDYMEDHMVACRLAVTAVFTRGMPNFRTAPPRAPADYDATIYHAMPHGLCDPLRCRIVPGAFVNTTSVHQTQIEALAAHQSQQHWLETSQGTNSYLRGMEAMSRAVGRLSGRFTHAEGWRRHLHLGFCPPAADPLREALGKDCLINLAYERNLRRGI